MAQYLNCSPTTVKTHLTVLQKHEIVYLEKHLYLKSTNEFKSEGKLVPVGIDFNKSKQRDLLRFTLIKRNLHTQYKAYTEKNNTLKLLQGAYFPHKVAKRLLKRNRHLKLTAESSLVNDMTLGNKKIGGICNRSQSTGLRIQKSFNNLYLITSFKRTEKVETGHVRRSFFEKFTGSSYFLSDKGTVFKRLTNGIILREACPQ